MSKYVLAISGGVDSVVLLDLMSKNIAKADLVVAHFDHGIRPNSAEDARFVESLANKYGLLFETRREELGVGASEELARNRRYNFLSLVAKKHNAKIVTAHHNDDVIESIAINIYRGTGWRGLAVMDSDIIRPLYHLAKKDIIDYARLHHLKWCEDDTNDSDLYLRNRIRKKLDSLEDDSKRQLLALWVTQKDLKRQIETEVEKLLASLNGFSRYFFICMDNDSAIEILRAVTGGLLTRPQLGKLLLAIKTMPAGKEFNAGSFVKVLFTTRNFDIKLLK